MLGIWKSVLCDKVNKVGMALQKTGTLEMIIGLFVCAAFPVFMPNSGHSKKQFRLPSVVWPTPLGYSNRGRWKQPEASGKSLGN